MKRIFLCLVALFITLDAAAQARSTSASARGGRGRTTAAAAIDPEIVRENCSTQFIAALDGECFDTDTLKEGGVYAKCKFKTQAELFDIMDMQLARQMGTGRTAEFLKECAPFRSFALDRWFKNREIVERSTVIGSADCQTSTRKLAAAQRCYSAAIAHDGNFFEFQRLMQQTCGTEPDVARRFAEAGDMSFGNLGRMTDNFATGQYTIKAAGWRTAVEAVLAGYKYQARADCGDENYEMIEFNRFAPDDRGNLAAVQRSAFAEQYARQMGARTAHGIATGRPMAIDGFYDPANVYNARATVPAAVSLTAGTVAAGGMLAAGVAGMITGAPPAVITTTTHMVPGTVNTVGVRQNIYVHDGTFGRPYNKTFGPRRVDGDIYLIDEVSNISSARARLINLIVNDSISGPNDRDAIDQKIVVGLGARANAAPAEVLNIVGQLNDGDVFVLTSQGQCQVLMIDGDRVRIMSRLEVQGRALVSRHLTRCREVIE
ncbi:MAG: hypothetical protein FWD15_00980 [Alphaproteobacteria bacterium]|nr:hypothetical protein [Alphaproteobacteria bacterium]